MKKLCALSLAALLVAFSEKGGYKITIIATLDVFFYLMSYLFRLRFMSKLAKSKDVRLNTRFFVEEQMVATPSLILILGVLALVGQGEQMMQLRAGFTSFFGSEYLWIAIVIGILSQGTGVFGGLILLGKQENTFCVPVNRSSSILAGVIAGLSLLAETGGGFYWVLAGIVGAIVGGVANAWVLLVEILR